MKRKKDFCISFLEMKAGRRKIAQSDFAENIEIDGLQIEYTDVMTGDKNRNRFLYYQLKMSMLKAKCEIVRYEL